MSNEFQWNNEYFFDSVFDLAKWLTILIWIFEVWAVLRVVAAFHFPSIFAAPPCRVGRLLLPFPWRVFGPATLIRWPFVVFQVVFQLDSKGAKVFESCRSRKMLQSAYLDVKIGVDTEQNEPSKVDLIFFNFHPPLGFNFHQAAPPCLARVRPRGGRPGYG